MTWNEESFKKLIDDILLIGKAELSGFEWEPNYDIAPEHKDIIISLLAQYLVIEKEHKKTAPKNIIDEAKVIIIESLIPNLKKYQNVLFQLGDSWLIKFNEKVSIIKHLAGLSYIAHLIIYKNEQQHVLKLYHYFDQKHEKKDWGNIHLSKDQMKQIGFTKEDIEKARKNITNRITNVYEAIGKNSKISSLEKYLRGHIDTGVDCIFKLNPGESEWYVFKN